MSVRSGVVSVVTMRKADDALDRDFLKRFRTVYRTLKCHKCEYHGTCRRESRVSDDGGWITSMHDT